MHVHVEFNRRTKSFAGAKTVSYAVRGNLHHTDTAPPEGADQPPDHFTDNWWRIVLKYEARIEDITWLKVHRQATADRHDLHVGLPEGCGALPSELQMPLGYVVCDYASSNRPTE
jgi:hypothetical protein